MKGLTNMSKLPNMDLAKTYLSSLDKSEIILTKDFITSLLEIDLNFTLENVKTLMSDMQKHGYKYDISKPEKKATNNPCQLIYNRVMNELKKELRLIGCTLHKAKILTNKKHPAKQMYESKNNELNQELANSGCTYNLKTLEKIYKFNPFSYYHNKIKSIYNHCYKLMNIVDENSEDIDDTCIRDNPNYIYFPGLERWRPIPDDEINEVITAAKNKDKKAIERLMNSHIRLVIKIANSYKSTEIDRHELISEGFVALGDAIKKYNSSKGFKFSTYAAKCIDNRIKSKLSEYGKFIILPLILKKILTVIRSCRNEYLEQNKIVLSKDDWTKILTFSLVKLKKLPVKSYKNLTVDNIRKYVYLIDSFDKDVIFFSSPVNDDEDQTFGDTIPGINYTEAEVLKGLTQKTLEFLISKLSHGDQKFIRMRIGFNRTKECPIKEVAKHFNISIGQAKRREQDILNELGRLKEKYKLKREDF
jgi:RNA polymerase sigma factor (sigma-70 family)